MGASGTAETTLPSREQLAFPEAEEVYSTLPLMFKRKQQLLSQRRLQGWSCGKKTARIAFGLAAI